MSGRTMRLALMWGVIAVGMAFGCVGMAAGQDEAMGDRPAFAGGQMVRGTVTGVAPDGKLTVRTEQGDVYQVLTTTNTRVVMGRQPVKVEAIAVGSGVGAMGLLDGPTKTVHAMMVMVVSPEDAKKAKEGMGKIYIAGRVTKIEETTLTIARTDGVVQKIELDEGTSFRRGGAGMRAAMSGGGVVTIPAEARQGPPAESITLLDVKVGDSVVGQGGMKGGVFVPKELNVMAAGAGRRGRRGAEGEATGAGLPAIQGGGQAPSHGAGQAAPQ